MSQLPPNPPLWPPPSVPSTGRLKPAWWKPRRSWKWWSATTVVVLVVLLAIAGATAPPTKPVVANLPAPIATAAVTVTPTVAPKTAAPTRSPTAHPAARSTAAPTARPTAPPTAAPTAAPTAGTSGCYIDPEGKCYRPGEYCPGSLHGRTVQGENGPITCEDKNGWRWVST